MSNLSRAVAWAQLGLAVFPCYEVDVWVGSRLHERKSPRPERGFLEATTEIALIERYWTANPTHLVGVVTGQLVNVLDIDMDPDKGKDGWNSLFENGIEVPETFHVMTASGGEHHFYRHPGSVELGPLVDIVLPNGSVLLDVDRRAGGSYFIAWSDDVPPSLESLSDSPPWLCSPRTSLPENAYHGTVSDWIESLSVGVASSRVQRAVERIPTDRFGHQEMIKRQTEIVKLGAEGHTGVEEALSSLREAWLTPPYDSPEFEMDWNTSLAGAVRKFGGLVEQESSTSSDHEDASFEADVLTRLRQEKIRLEAERILAAEFYVGADELTWDALETMEMSYIVQDLVPEDAICFLVAKRNVGKTFAYLDMVCSMAAGKPWLGKETRQAKTTIVIGEGKNGYIDRIKAWCHHHTHPYEDLKQWISFIDGANLNSDVAIQRIRKVAMRESSELIVFDTWSNTSGVSNEDDGALNSITLNRATAIKPGTTLFFVHHPNKATQNTDAPVMRGSGTLEGRADVVMTMYMDKDFVSSVGEKQQWIAMSTDMDHQGKNRSARTETLQGLYLEDAVNSKVLSRSAFSGVSRHVYLVLTNLKDGMSVKDFATATGLTETTARRALKAAEADGTVYVSSRAAGKNPAKFSFMEGKDPGKMDLAELSKVFSPKKVA